MERVRERNRENGMERESEGERESERERESKKKECCVRAFVCIHVYNFNRVEKGIALHGWTCATLHRKW